MVRRHIFVTKVARRAGAMAACLALGDAYLSFGCNIARWLCYSISYAL